MTGFKGYYPSSIELESMPGVVNDLGAFTEYTNVLGNSAVPASTLTSRIVLALGWRGVRDTTEAWDEYVKVQDALAWKSAMTALDEVKPLFLFAVSKNPSLATTYSWLAKLFNAPKAISEQANATKAKNKAAKAKTAAEAATAAAVATATEASNKETDATAPTPPKTVTVNA